MGLSMSANSDASSGRPLCRCGAVAFVRYSWTNDNYSRKWYGCEKYKQVGDCGFFLWADNEMTTYEKRIMRRLKDIEEQTRAEIGRLEKLLAAEQAQYRTHLENMFQSRDEMWKSLVANNQSRAVKFQFKQMTYQAVLALLVLLVFLYVGGYNASSGSKLMLK
ncbi:uncharacterized protein LOC132176048 [Corylus avellana]|uniref:uncharacterized protein LOC132176048 n=1 Tax=Corylus avellana TaxID=13451 RepID=UPI00286B9D62|nr:uncharacterized protein LOC132176048 [Corylus avellana]